jgi:hypothetical protein
MISLTSSEVRNYKRELKCLLKDSLGVTDHLGIPRYTNLHLDRIYVNFGNFILERGENYDKEGCHGHMGKGASTHWVLELAEAVENFLRFAL